LTGNCIIQSLDSYQIKNPPVFEWIFRRSLLEKVIFKGSLDMTWLKTQSLRLYCFLHNHSLAKSLNR
ncbi:hypothetical protein, partial [Flectobacillus roseus]|uniref:hypothetical protein n=1 Tax=Flectobacillus roseus TaxID=502259 RepID=UPI0024B7C1DE